MTGKQRILAAVNHKPSDRVPVDYWARADVTSRLMSFLGLQTQEQLYQRLGIDIRKIPVAEHHLAFEARTTGVLKGASESCGRKYILHGDGSFEDAWGIVRRLGPDGLYDEWVSGPFVDTTDLDAFAWPQGEIYDSVECLKARVNAGQGEYALFGRLNLPFKIAWHMRGLENFLCDMLMDSGFAKSLLRRIARYETEKGLRLVAAGVDIIGIYGDVGMQDRMLVVPDAWRETEKPILADMIKAFKARNPGILMFFHSDGDIREVLPDLIEIGFNIINPIQPECMDPAAVKRDFGDRITLHGTISIQKTLPQGTVADVRREVRERIRTCGQNGGLIICPANLIQNDTPLENIIALYDAVHHESAPA